MHSDLLDVSKSVHAHKKERFRIWRPFLLGVGVLGDDATAHDSSSLLMFLLLTWQQSRARLHTETHSQTHLNI